MCDDLRPHTPSKENILTASHYELWSVFIKTLCNRSIYLTSAKLCFSSSPNPSPLLSHHFMYASYRSSSLPPASLLLLILSHLLPSSFSAICLHSVCASRKFPLCLWGELRFSLLRSSLVLLLYVFHAGKASSSCMQQGVCSVCGCPIRDPTVWCYNLPIQRDPLSTILSLWLLFSLSFLQDVHALIFFPVSDYFILFSLTYFLNLFIWLLALWHFPPYTLSCTLSHSLSLPPPALTLKMTPFSCLLFCFPVFFSGIGQSSLSEKHTSETLCQKCRKEERIQIHN